MTICKRCGEDSERIAAMTDVVEAAEVCVEKGGPGCDMTEVTAAAWILTRAVIAYRRTRVATAPATPEGGPGNAFH